MVMNTTAPTAGSAATAPAASRVMAVPPAPSAEAAAYFAARLAFHTDVADVHAALAEGAGDFVVVDSRSTASWDQGHVPGAVHLPTAQIPQLARQFLDPAVPVVVYCWGPGCDGATRAALALARLGYRVKEMLGGIEYWIREGYAVETADGTRQLPPDPLTAPLGTDDCGC
ncbi:rhodanese-like domain-containing protein [Streptomyces roseifaciens]|uniref:rhodanese-like domain-containing protein n=1 Tax=Streptomyces roseifaciens TaxID=1488406 RepID=UPI00099F6949|nr:rhodanese-like domain-containing protein [Streptomyces roseifaciens]